MFGDHQYLQEGIQFTYNYEFPKGWLIASFTIYKLAEPCPCCQHEVFPVGRQPTTKVPKNVRVAV